MLMQNAPANPQFWLRSKCCAILSDAVIIAKKVAMYSVQNRNTLVVSVNTLVASFICCLFILCSLSLLVMQMLQSQRSTRCNISRLQYNSRPVVVSRISTLPPTML